MKICSGYLILGILLLQFSNTSEAIAEGRMYIPKAEPTIKYQLCRLRKVDRDQTGTACRYKPQKGGEDIVVTTEDPRTVCQREYTCKIR